MKKLLVLLFSLSSWLAGYGQTTTGTGSQTLTIAPASGYSGTPYVIKVRRDVNTYPLTTSGYNSFAAAVASGTFSYTVVSNGCVVAAGTPPPLNAPTCTTTPAAPSWVTGLQWRHDGTTLTVQAAGDVAQIAFGTSPATTFTTTNPDGVPIQSGTFYYPATVSNGSYTKQWQINKGQTTFVVTLKNSSGATYDKSFSTPITGNLFNAVIGTASNPTSTAGLAGDPRTVVGTRNGNTVYAGTGLNYLMEVYSTNPDQFSPRGGNLSMTRTGTIPSNVVNSDFGGLAVPAGTVKPSGYRNRYFPDGALYFEKSTAADETPPGSTTTNSTSAVYNKVLFVGNSILYHPAVPAWNWNNNNGMAASAPDKDFYHIVQAYLKSKNASVDTRMWGDFTGTSVAEGGYWEGNYWQLDGGMSRYDAVAAYAPDLIIFRLGENVTDTSHDYLTAIGTLVDKLKSASPNAKVVVTGSVWADHQAANDVQKQFATNKGYPFVELFDMASNPNYFASQYSDPGVKKHPNDAGMAEIASRIIAKIPSSTTTTTPGGTTGPASFVAGYGEGTVSQLMAFAPFVPSSQTDQLNSWDFSYNRFQSIFSSNNTLRLTVDGVLGGSLTGLALNGGKNWINTNADGSSGTYTYTRNGVTKTVTGLPDPGRSAVTWSMYGYPRMGYTRPGNNSIDGHAYGSTSEYFDTGRNGVPGGSVYKYYSGLQAYEKRVVNGKQVLYTKVQPMVWALHGFRSSTVVHNFLTFDDDPHAVEFFSIVENNSTGETGLEFKGSEQEAPFAFLTADLYYHWIWQGTGPVTASGMRLVSPGQPTEDGNQQTNATFGGAYQGTKAFIGATDQNGNGVWIVPRYNNRFNVRRILANGGDSTSNQAAYIQSAVMMNFDTPGNHAFSGYVYVGSKADFAAWFNAKNIQTTPFSWSFSAGKTCGWWSGDTPATFNSDNRYEFTIQRNDGALGNFCPPYGVYQAADIPKIYIKGKFSPGVTSMDLRWNRFDQDDNASNSAGQVVTLSGIIQDGQEHTYEINMAGRSGWSGVVSSLRFMPPIGATYNQNHKFVPSYIGNVAPNAASDWQTLIALSIMAGGIARRRKRIVGVRQAGVSTGQKKRQRV